jgi:hypothetical protein
LLNIVPVCVLLTRDKMTEAEGVSGQFVVLVSSWIASALLLCALSASVQFWEKAESNRCQEPLRIVLPLF